MKNFFMEFDKSGAEWVVVAYLTGDANMLSVIESGISPHVKTGNLLTGVSFETIEKENKIIGDATDPDRIRELRATHFPNLYDEAIFLPRTMSIRQIGKKSNHALNYDEGYRVFSMTAEIEESEGKKVVELYKYKAYPMIPIWHEAVQQELKSNGRVVSNCFGRKRRFLDAWGREMFKQAYAYIPQSTVVDMVNQGLVSIYRDESKRFESVQLMAQVHDSILIQYPINRWLDAAHISTTIDKYMSPTCHYNGRDFKVKTDLKVGINWSKRSMVELKIHGDVKKLAQQIKKAWESLNEVTKS